MRELQTWPAKWQPCETIRLSRFVRRCSRAIFSFSNLLGTKTTSCSKCARTFLQTWGRCWGRAGFSLPIQKLSYLMSVTSSKIPTESSRCVTRVAGMSCWLVRALDRKMKRDCTRPASRVASAERGREVVRGDHSTVLLEENNGSKQCH